MKSCSPSMVDAAISVAIARYHRITQRILCHSVMRSENAIVISD